jgi:hypothetical protein
LSQAGATPQPSPSGGGPVVSLPEVLSLLPLVELSLLPEVLEFDSELPLPSVITPVVAVMFSPPPLSQAPSVRQAAPKARPQSRLRFAGFNCFALLNHLGSEILTVELLGRPVQAHNHCLRCLR